jgi:hypothetical protein
MGYHKLWCPFFPTYSSSWHRDNLQDTGKVSAYRKPDLASIGCILYLKGNPIVVRASDTGMLFQGTYIGD